ncbi:hypothetical protein IQ07DRAFT_622072 [Pyrenochaeta sp. DS3sAY3a]|nr:hypothetical protein IQ07DRAFT_622072 [Pyrenochaeta sp. DS3sAY3a]
MENADEAFPRVLEGGTEDGSIVTALHHKQGKSRSASLRQEARAKVHEDTRTQSRTITTTTPITTTMSPALSDDNDASSEHVDPQEPVLDAPSEGKRGATNKLIRPTSFTSLRSYLSTTDEDDSISNYPPSITHHTASFQTPAQTSTTSLLRRRPSRLEQVPSQPTSMPFLEADTDDDWDYAETERWGWFLLIATWIVFVVVMGSCLGVWSWAWDVGETPYAPPDLEDDATLPITGYYPALIVCTAVMSWVWVVVAWVGMKYFRHAKVVGDEG